MMRFMLLVLAIFSLVSAGCSSMPATRGRVDNVAHTADGEREALLEQIGQLREELTVLKASSPVESVTEARMEPGRFDFVLILRSGLRIRCVGEALSNFPVVVCR